RTTMNLVRTIVLSVAALLLGLPSAEAQVFGTVRVTVRDPQNLTVPNAGVVIKAAGSTWSQTAMTGAQGDAVFLAVPFGRYTVSVNAAGFDVLERQIEVISNTQ